MFNDRKPKHYQGTMYHSTRMALAAKRKAGDTGPSIRTSRITPETAAMHAKKPNSEAD